MDTGAISTIDPGIISTSESSAPTDYSIPLTQIGVPLYQRVESGHLDGVWQLSAESKHHDLFPGSIRNFRELCLSRFSTFTSNASVTDNFRLSHVWHDARRAFGSYAPLQPGIWRTAWTTAHVPLPLIPASCVAICINHLPDASSIPKSCS